jgi:hypothetical protein
MNWRLKFYDASLYLTTPSLHRTLMLFHNIDALDDDSVLLGIDALNNSPGTPLIARNHFDGIPSLYSKHLAHTPKALQALAKRSS